MQRLVQRVKRTRLIHKCEYSTTVSMSAFQAENVSSILITRSVYESPKLTGPGGSEYTRLYVIENHSDHF